MSAPAGGQASGAPPQLLAATAAAAFDNLLAGPLLVAIGDSYDRSLGDVAIVASGYFFAYGLAQLAWARASDRLGRVTVIRAGLLLGACAAAIAAIPGPLWSLIAARLLGASAMAAVVPTSLTYVGERAAPAERARAASTLVAAYAASTALAAIFGGALAATGAWRVAFAISAALLASALVLVRSLAPDRPIPAAATGRAETLRTPWATRLLALAGLWGAVMLGGLALLVPALAADGDDRALAGSTLALYGLAVVLASRAIARYLPRLPAPQPSQPEAPSSPRDSRWRQPADYRCLRRRGPARRRIRARPSHPHRLGRRSQTHGAGSGRRTPRHPLLLRASRHHPAARRTRRGSAPPSAVAPRGPRSALRSALGLHSAGLREARSLTKRGLLPRLRG